MAQMKCKQCGVGISKNATACPKCGEPVKKTSLLTWIVLVIVVFIVISILTEESQQDIDAKQSRQDAVRKAEQNKINAAYFSEHSTEILSDVKKEIDAGNVEMALSVAEKYITTNNSELSALYNPLKIDKILNDLKSIPVSEYEKNKNLYSELVKLDPENKKYKDKINFYIQKQAEHEARERALAQREERIKRQFSAWDGSHSNLERVIKQSMNDPKSYDHVETIYWDKGDHLIVKTTFRGKNAFGGVVVNWIRANIDLNGNVYEIIDQGP